MPKLEDLNIKIFCDSANPLVHKDHPWVKGFTTNPSLMHKAGIRNYEKFARTVLEEITDRPISFEVFADDAPGMIGQARKISSWGDNVYVKIPITNTRGSSNNGVIRYLTGEGIKINITAVMTIEQVVGVFNAWDSTTPGIISMFAGRIADTGNDPEECIWKAHMILTEFPQIQLLWASCREVFNILQAADADCDIITVTPPILYKLHLIGKDLTQYSLETVQEFYNDAREAGYTL